MKWQKKTGSGKRSEKKIFWRMLLTKQLQLAIGFLWKWMHNINCWEWVNKCVNYRFKSPLITLFYVSSNLKWITSSSSMNSRTCHCCSSSAFEAGWKQRCLVWGSHAGFNHTQFGPCLDFLPLYFSGESESSRWLVYCLACHIKIPLLEL